MLRTALNTVKWTGGSAVAGSVGYGTYLYNTDEGTSRMITAYSTFGPVVLRYRWLEFRQNNFTGILGAVTDEDWAALDRRYAVPTIETLGRLQGMYCKYGQTAAGFTNTMSDTWIVELRRLESDVPAQPVAVVEQTLREELGVEDLKTVFASLDPVPLGSASIGQVHRARLRSDGREVAIKVQYPGVVDMFRDDMKTIRGFCRTFAPENLASLDALEKQNAEEMDYTREASNLREVHANMVRGGFSPGEVTVPLPVESIPATRRMLVMDLLPGPKLIDGVRAFYRHYAEQNNTTLEELEQEARRKIEEEGVPAKYEGPSAAQIQRYQKILSLKDALLNTPIALYNTTLGRIFTPIRYHHTNVPLNTPRIVDTLMRVHGHQLLHDGCFNADPHGGNFLLVPDDHHKKGETKIGLIDYGATKRLTRNERITACVLYAALYRRDEDLLYDLCEISGYKSKYGRKDVLMKLMRFSYDTWGADLMEGRNVQQFVDHVKETDPWEETPDNFVMAVFMSIRLRSLMLGMNHPVVCSDWWGPLAEEVLRQEGLPYDTWDRDMLIKYMPEPNIQKYDMS